MDNPTPPDLLNEEAYKDLFDNAHDLIYLAQLDGTLIYVNPSWVKLLEYSTDEIKEKSIYSLLDEEDATRFMEYRKTLINQGSYQKEIILRLNSKSGKKIITEGFVSVKYKNDVPIYTRGIFRDITEKLNNESKLQVSTKQLQEREANLQQLLFYAPDAIVVIDQESSVLYWNPKSEMLFGWKLEEVKGKPLYELIIPTQYREAHNNGMKRYLATGKGRMLNTTVDVTALNKKGEEFFISLTISTTFQNGELAFIAFIRDITIQKLGELELQNKRKELEASNKELEQFAYAASHDMQEPLRKIQTFSSFLLEHELEKLSPKGANFLYKINQSCQRMKGIIDALLNYSHHADKEHQFVAIDLNEVVENQLTDLELMIQQKEARVTTDKLPLVLGIAVQMDQLFYNLLHNALKFSRADVQTSIHIGCRTPGPDRIRIKDLDKSVSYTEISISDNGIGFDPEYSEKIFNLFQRLNERYSYEGTGIGLTLCKKIVMNHRGAIWVESEINQGSTFYILLPLAE